MKVQLISMVGAGRNLVSRGKLEMQMDITAPEDGVHVHWNEDNSVLWVDVDGVCALRVCQIPTLKIGEE